MSLQTYMHAHAHWIGCSCLEKEGEELDRHPAAERYEETADEHDVRDVFLADASSWCTIPRL